MKIKYRGWTITDTDWGFCATHDRFHDESGKWQVNGSSFWATIFEINDIMDDFEETQP